MALKITTDGLISIQKDDKLADMNPIDLFRVDPVEAGLYLRFKSNNDIYIFEYWDNSISINGTVVTKDNYMDTLKPLFE